MSSVFHDMSCEAALEAFQDALDERVAPLKRSPWLLAHLADCAVCRQKGQQLQALHRLAEKLRPSAAAEVLPKVARFAAAAGVALSLYVGQPQAEIMAIEAPVVAKADSVSQDSPADGLDGLIQEIAERDKCFGRDLGDWA